MHPVACYVEKACRRDKAVQQDIPTLLGTNKIRYISSDWQCVTTLAYLANFTLFLLYR